LGGGKMRSEEEFKEFLDIEEKREQIEALENEIISLLNDMNNVVRYLHEVWKIQEIKDNREYQRKYTQFYKVVLKAMAYYLNKINQLTNNCIYYFGGE
jgi:uncharacterized protein (DUF608 family)